MKNLYRGCVIAMCMIAGMAAGPAAWSQDWPGRSISLMVGFAPGGGTDVTARLFAQKLTGVLGQSVVVENRPGAAGNIAAENVVKAQPDGYHILMIASGTFINNVLTSRPRYDIIKDLEPISFVTISPLVLVVGPTIKARTVPEFIEELRARPNPATYSGDGVGGTQQLAGEIFSSMTGVKILHVPFKGSADATTAVAAGQVDFSFPSATASAPLLQSGKVRALAITSAERSSVVPACPP
jgi:tripartite-type tricarboxylate transporter receptor subunit TctC